MDPSLCTSQINKTIPGLFAYITVIDYPPWNEDVMEGDLWRNTQT